MTETSPSDAVVEGAPATARRPLLSLTVAALAGWLAGLAGWCGCLTALAVAAVVLGLVFLRVRSALATWMLHLATAAVALAHAALVADSPAPNDISRHLQGRRDFAELIGAVADEPIQREDQSWVFPVHVEALRAGSSWLTASGNAEVRLRQADGPAPLYGERWSVAGLAVPTPGKPMAAIVQARAGARRLQGEPGSRFHRWLLQRRQAASAALGLGFRSGDAKGELEMLRALLLGERAELDPAVRQAFARTGTLHIVAISGSHIAAVMLLLVAVCKAMGRSRTAWILYAGPVLALYTLGTGMSASALRAGVMSLVLLAGPAFRRRTDGATALSAAGLVILAVSPFQLQDRGFVLSFLIVGGLMMLYRPILNFLNRWLPGDPWQLEHPPHIAAARWVARNVFALLAASLAAWLVSLPLTARFFNLFSPVGLVANLFVVPIAFVILLTGCLSFASSLFSTFLASVFNHANVLFVKAMLGIVAWFNELPGGYRFVEAPPVWAIVAYFILLFGCFLLRGRHRWTAVGLSVVSIFAAAVAFWISTSARVECWRNAGTMSVFLDLPRDRHVLINTGRSFGSRSLERMLRTRGVNTLDALILTSASADVLGAAQPLLTAVPAREVWIPDYAGRSPTTESLLRFCSEHDMTVRRLVAGNDGALPGHVHWQILHPATGATYRSASAGGLLVRLSRGPAALMIRGSTADQDVLSRPHDLDADLLVDLAGEPQASEGFVRAVRPRTILSELNLYEQEAATDSSGAQRVGLAPDDLWMTEWPSPGSKSAADWASGEKRTKP